MRVPLVAELELERAGDLGEEVEVDERPDDHVEDLLDHVAGEDSGEVRPSDDRDVHDERDERAHVRRDDVVQRNAGGVGREHGHVGHAAGIRVAQDPVPAERGQQRLGALEEAAQDDVAERDRGDRVPEALEPAPDVDAERAAGRARTTRIPTSQAAILRMRRRGCSPVGVGLSSTAASLMTARAYRSRVTDAPWRRAVAPRG